MILMLMKKHTNFTYDTNNEDEDNEDIPNGTGMKDDEDDDISNDDTNENIDGDLLSERMDKVREAVNQRQTI
jgi:hypothetical protein